jgi:superfamily II DNA or RNA helicase
MTDLAQDLRRLIEAGSVRRGVDYHARGHVTSAEADPNGAAASGIVAGSGGRAYRQDIALEWTVNGRLAEVDGDCTCPVGWNCKHVVAVLLSLERQLRSRTRTLPAVRPDDAWISGEMQRWLERLAAMPTDDSGGEAYPANVKDRIAYVISPTRVGPPRVKVFKTRVLASGELSARATSYSAGNARSYGTVKFLRPSDLQILPALNNNPHYGLGGEGYGLPDGRAGQWLMSEILRTGRARLGAVDGLALSEGPPRQARFEWTAVPSGQQVMRAVTEDGAQLTPLGLEPPWYVDMSSGTSGPLETGLTPARAALLASAPPLDPKEAHLVAGQLGALTGGPVPLPAQPRREEVRDVRPQPVLRLFAVAAYGRPVGGRRRYNYMYERPAQTLPALCPTFDYEGLRCAPASAKGRIAPLERVAPALVRLIHRDPAAEREALDDFEAFAEGYGFVPTTEIDRTFDHPERLDDAMVLPPVDEVDATVRIGELLAPHIDDALAFMAEVAPELEARGWRIEIDESWPVAFAPGPAELSGGFETKGTDWFRFTLKVTVGETEADLAPILTEIVLSMPPEMLAADDLEDRLADVCFYPALPDGRRFALDGRAVAPLLKAFQELTGLTGDLHFAEAGAAWRVAEALEGSGIAFAGRAALEDLLRRLRALTDPASVPMPAGLEAELRPYQRQGIGWLVALAEAGFGGVLADDMGLGKTLQALALLVCRHGGLGGAGRPSLVVMPTSLVSTWLREAGRFAPGLRVLVLHGPDRAKRFASIPDHDVVLTTYPLLHRDHEVLFAQAWDVAILDEAQAVKNPASAVAKHIRKIDARLRMALTGTPLENNLEELWALLDWVNPGLLGTRSTFREGFRKPIENDGDTAANARLVVRTRPFLLRRTKEAVAADLPPRTEIVETVPLGASQSALYETIRVAMDARVRDALNARGLAASRITVLDALLKMRQAACDPALVKVPAARKVRESAKRARLVEMLESLVAEGRKVLVFSQFVEMLKLIEADIAGCGWQYAMLTGQTRKRAEVIDRFQSGAVDLFLISLKAGGTGLTLTAADTVILYDPWWNPATERQAMDRAHRIGQTKPVFVYRLIAEGTVEAAIQDLQKRKQALADALFDEGQSGTFEMSDDEIIALFGAAG